MGIKLNKNGTTNDAKFIFTNWYTNAYSYTDAPNAPTDPDKDKYFTNKKIAFVFNKDGLVLPTTLPDCKDIVVANYDYKCRYFDLRYMSNNYNGTRYYWPMYVNRGIGVDQLYTERNILRCTEEYAVQHLGHFPINTLESIYNEGNTTDGSNSHIEMKFSEERTTPSMAIGAVVKFHRNQNSYLTEKNFILGIKGGDSTTACYNDGGYLNFANGTKLGSHACCTQIDTDTFFLNATASNILPTSAIPDSTRNENIAYLYATPIVGFNTSNYNLSNPDYELIDWYVAFG